MKSKLLKNLLLSFTFLVGSVMYAQKVTGTVSDGSDALPGVSIQVKGSTTGTETDFDGNYSINANSGDVLVFNYLGYKSEERTVGSEAVINVSLLQDATSLDEIVVVGYGSSVKKEITSSVTQVSAAALQVARVDDALAGKLSGVLIQNQDGSPGAAPKIQIRAASSISGASNPLIVVDGYPISGGIETVNPNDIQSLEILKDAASAAIYGSRGLVG